MTRSEPEPYIGSAYGIAPDGCVIDDTVAFLLKIIYDLTKAGKKNRRMLVL